MRLLPQLSFLGKRITGSLHYLRTGRLKSHQYSEQDLEDTKERLISRIDKIIQDNNFIPTNNERVCSFCDHGKSGACGIGAVRFKKFNRDI